MVVCWTLFGVRPLPRSLSSPTSSLAHLADAPSPTLHSPCLSFTRSTTSPPPPSSPRPQSIAGYVASRLYLSFNGDAIRKNILYTALVFPAALYAFLLFLDAFLIGLGSAGAVPLGTLFAIGTMWFGINVPLTVLGGWLGVRKGVSRGASPPLPLLLSLCSAPRLDPTEHSLTLLLHLVTQPLNVPLRVNQIPRQIPPLPWWLRPVPSALLAGILPFGASILPLARLVSCASTL